mmetsp:Transcript_21294/g.30937  ORF Transcript_21294/g.30937 Transcript_21294/m.30937 type:complete len:97 (+) Transcript_21294:2608-2898(+)
MRRREDQGSRGQMLEHVGSYELAEGFSELADQGLKVIGKPMKVAFLFRGVKMLRHFPPSIDLCLFCPGSPAAQKPALVRSRPSETVLSAIHWACKC